MIDPKRPDLHMHSTVSDGTDTPAEILDNARKTGLTLFSLTDHDALKGCGVIKGLLNGEDPCFITGVEFSCKDEDGKYHILGYGYDPDAPAINGVIDTGHKYRIEKVRARLDFLEKEFGFSFSEEDIRQLFALDNPGKPHIGNLMVRYGYADSKENAIKQYINQMRFKSEYVRPEQAITGILASGGIPVLAHPFYGNGDQLILGEEMEERIKKLMDMGLKGVEAFYSGFTAKLTKQMLAYAAEYGLYVTAGSDYHGKNKMIPMGDTGLADAEEIPEGMYRFFEAVLEQ